MTEKKLLRKVRQSVPSVPFHEVVPEYQSLVMGGERLVNFSGISCFLVTMAHRRP